MIGAIFSDPFFMKTARLNRLFNPATGRCFDVALDHGFFNEPSFLAGIENLPAAIATVGPAFGGMFIAVKVHGTSAACS
jgi:DhnA family fructose-bisphosphate aldolase class Ia